jgi:aconitate hydratase
MAGLPHLTRFAKAKGDLSMGETLTRKILLAHLAAGTLEPGSDATVAVDQVLIEDATGTMAAMQF